MHRQANDDVGIPYVRLFALQGTGHEEFKPG